MSNSISAKTLHSDAIDSQRPRLSQGRFSPFLPVDVHPAVYTLKQHNPYDDKQHREGIFLHAPLPVSEQTAEAMSSMGDSRHEKY